MSCIKDKVCDRVSSALLPLEFAAPVRSGKGTIGELVASYLPKAFDILTRGINDSSFRSKVVQALPFLASEKGVVEEICAYIDNRSMMLRILDELPQRDEVLGELVTWLERISWTDPLLQREHLDQYLLEAVRKGVMSLHEFSSLSMFLMAKKTASRNPVVLPLLDGNKTGLEAEKLVKESFRLKSTPRLPSDDVSVCSDEQYQKFIQEVRKFPRTEHAISLVPFQDDTVVDAINKAGINLFGKVSLPQPVLSGHSHSSSHSMMVAPLGMVQAFLNVKFGENAVELLPVVGPTPFVSELRNNGLNGTRVVALDNSILLQLTGLAFPDIADGSPAPGPYSTYHDACFHSYLSSSVPRPLRQRFIAFYDFTRAQHAALLGDPGQWRQQWFLEDWRFKFADMEHIDFIPEMVALRSNQNPLSIFWKCCAVHILRCIYVRSGSMDLSIYEAVILRWTKALLDHRMIGQEDLEGMRLEAARLEAIPSEHVFLPALKLIVPNFDLVIKMRVVDLALKGLTIA